MQQQHIGIQRLVINHQNTLTQILIEMNESNYNTLLFIDGNKYSTLYPNPSDAYIAAIKILNLSNQLIDISIEVAINVMEVADIKDLFLSNGVSINQLHIT